MSEDEIIKYAKIFSTARGDTFKIHIDDKTINEPDVWKGVLEYIEKLQKENEELKAINAMQKYRIEVIDERELISKEEIKEYIKENKELKECHFKYEEMTGIDLLLGE